MAESRGTWGEHLAEARRRGWWIGFGVGLVAGLVAGGLVIFLVVR